MTAAKIYQPLAGLMAERLEWQTRALCRYEDPEVFFPNQGSSDGIRAKAICNACPVVEECRAYALANRESHGVWGGTSVAERDEILHGRPVEISDGKGGPRCQRLTREQQADALERLSQGWGVKPLAREYGVDDAVVRRLRDRHLGRAA